MAEKQITDGTVSWIGGMDTSRSPSIIAENQYTLGVNVDIARGKEGVETRRGFRCLQLVFGTSKEQEIFEKGNVQGIGSYFHRGRGSIITVLSINGYIIEVINRFGNIYDVVFSGFRNNPWLKKAYISNTPEGVIVSDGQSGPIYLFENRRGRVRPGRMRIGPNHGGVYVQNRFWYIDETKKFVIGSTIGDSLSIEEAVLTNIYGFRTPEDEDLVAVGNQRTISRDALGGNLAFATNKANYSVDVRGDRTRWGFQSGIGSVENVVNEVGAISPFSYEPANSNIYFRNTYYGLMSTRSSQFQFQNNDSFSPVSIESSLIFDNDTKEFLDHCYTKVSGDRIYTTVAPQLNDDGFVYWSGLLVISPDIYFSTKDRTEINRVESIYTGVRPWGITVARDSLGIDNMFIISHDTDCINRLYIYDPEIDHDLNNRGVPIEIESKVMTRLYQFGSNFVPKGVRTQFYSFSATRDSKIAIYSRHSGDGIFKSIWNADHKIQVPARSLVPINFTRPSGENVFYSFGEDAFYERQDLFVMNGPVRLLKNIIVANKESIDTSLDSSDKFISEKDTNCFDPERIYSYSIQEDGCIPSTGDNLPIDFVEV